MCGFLRRTCFTVLITGVKIRTKHSSLPWLETLCSFRRHERWSWFFGICTVFLPFPWLVLVLWKAAMREWKQPGEKILALTEEFPAAEQSEKERDGKLHEYEKRRTNSGLSWDSIWSRKAATTDKRERTNGQFCSTEITVVGQRVKSCQEHRFRFLI